VTSRKRARPDVDDNSEEQLGHDQDGAQKSRWTAKNKELEPHRLCTLLNYVVPGTLRQMGRVSPWPTVNDLLPIARDYYQHEDRFGVRSVLSTTSGEWGIVS
jgi:hypothetical protein